MIVIADAQRGRVGATIIAIWLILIAATTYGIWAISSGQLFSDNYGWQLLILAFLPLFAVRRQIAVTRAFLRHAAFLFIDGDRLVQCDPDVFSTPLADVSELRAEGSKLVIIAAIADEYCPAGQFVAAPTWQLIGGRHGGGSISLKRPQRGGS